MENFDFFTKKRLTRADIFVIIILNCSKNRFRFKRISKGGVFLKKVYVLDRVEEGVAILIADDESMVSLSAEELPGARDGDVFRYDTDTPSAPPEPDPELTAERRRRTRERFRRLTERRRDSGNNSDK